MKHVCRGLAVLALLALFCAGAAAQELVSVAELHAQAEAMGGWWNEMIDAPGGALTVNAPVIVPDVEAMPVVTLEAAKIPEETYEQVVQGKRLGKSDQMLYAVEWDGRPFEVFLGYENDYVNGEKTDIRGYEAVDALDMSHGDAPNQQADREAERLRPGRFVGDRLLL